MIKQGQGFFAEREIIIFLFLDGQSVAGQLFDISDEQSQPSWPHIHLRWTDKQEQPQSDVVMDNYQLRLKFDEIEGNSVKGNIVLKIPDLPETYVSGSFTALVEK